MAEERSADARTPLQEVFAGRRSIRRYLSAPVEPEKLRACLEAARIAPSANNVQPWRFVVVDEPALKDRLAEEAFSGQNYFPDALERQRFYDPPERGFEREIRKRLEYWAKLRKERGGG